MDFLCALKVRKLEFALADALSQGSDSIVTIGGTRSNHARSTAVAARELGLEPHLLMITDDYEVVTRCICEPLLNIYTMLTPKHWIF